MEKESEYYSVIKPVSRFHLNLNEIWAYRELFYFFTWRDIKVKYKQTALGFTWALLQPFVMMLIFTFVFGNTMQTKETYGIPYPLFVYTGLMIWNIFSSGLQNAGNSMVSNANIIQKIYFPRLIIPVSSVLGTLLDFVITLVLYICLLFYYQVGISVGHALLYFPLAIIITLLSALGAGTLLAALNVKYRDFRYIIPFLVQMLLFITPVVYPKDMVENEYLRYLLEFNPMGVAIDLARSVYTDNPIDVMYVIKGSAMSVFLLVLGVYYFRKTESYFADIA
jgi:lipopolysaccharide transport system permease protein